MTDDVAECEVCGVRSDDDDLDDFHRLQWADRDDVDASDLPDWLVGEQEGPQ